MYNESDSDMFILNPKEELEDSLIYDIYGIEEKDGIKGEIKDEIKIKHETIIEFPKKGKYNNVYLYMLTWITLSIALSIPLFIRSFENSDYDMRFTVNEITEWILLIVRLMYLPYFVHIVLILYSLIPLKLYSAPSKIDINSKKLHFCFVSRGTNKKALFRSVAHMHSVFHLFLPENVYDIRVLIDEDVDFGSIPVKKFIVPNHYHPMYEGEETKFKARAIQYMNDMTEPTEDDWLIHLDEETLFNWKTLNEICYFISKSTKNEIGQGIITYDSNKYNGIQHLFTTLADSMRTSVDCSIFRLQFMLGYPIFGIKGSFIVVNALTEKNIGFNYGNDVNITEDTFFAIKCWDKGLKFRFIPAMMKETSPHTFKEFIKQRRRWLIGLRVVIRSNKLNPKHTRILKVMIFLWQAGILSWIPLLINYFIRFHTLPELNVILMFMLSIYLFEYLWGLVVHEKDFPIIKVFLQLFFVFPIPLYPALECASILYTWWKPDPGFHIVNKD